MTPEQAIAVLRLDPLTKLSALNVLTENEREAYVDRRVLKHTSREIAGRMGVHPDTVTRLERRADRKYEAELLRIATQHTPAPDLQPQPVAGNLARAL